MKCENGKCYCRGKCALGVYRFGLATVYRDGDVDPAHRIKELEALAQKLVDAMKDAHPFVADDAKRAAIGNMIVESAKLGIK